MTSPKKEVAPAKLSRGDHEEESHLTRPESYEAAQGIDSPYREAENGREPLPAHDCALYFLLQRQPVGPWQVCYIPPVDDGAPREWRTYGPENIDELRRYLERVTKQNNVHWTVNPPRRTMVTKPCEADVIVHRAHVDVDLPPPPAGAGAPDQVAAFLQAQLEAMHAQFERFVPKPTALVFTGGGYQAFWDFAEPVTDYALVKSINEQIARRFNGDGRKGDRCHSVDHLMRLPGTINHPKPSKVAMGRRKALAQVVWDTGTKYRPEDFFAAGFTRPDAQESRDAAAPVAKVARGEVVRLASLDDLPASANEKCRRVIELGRDADPEHYPSDSEPVYFVMMELWRCGVDPGLIVGIVTDPKWGVSKHVRKKRSEGKAIKYAWDQLERNMAKEQGIPPVLSEHVPLRSAREFLRREMPHVRHFRGDWFVYNGSCYMMLEDATIRTRLYRFLDAAQAWSDKAKKLVPFCPTSKKVSGVQDALAAETNVPGESYLEATRWLANTEGLPPPREVISVANGLLHLPSRRLLSATPAFFTQNALSLSFDPKAPEPALWLRTLKQWWPNDPQSIALLQEWYGYVLVGATDMHKIMLLRGETRSGKSTLADVLTALVGTVNVTAPTLQSLATDFGPMQLIGKLLAIISEAEVGKRNDEAGKAGVLLKKISGEDTVSINRKHKAFWVGKLGVRFFLICNKLPEIADPHGALANRFLVLDMGDVNFLGREDRTLKDRLMQELPGIMNWALAGYDRLLAQGHFTQPESTRDVRDQLEDLSSSVLARLFREHFVLDESAAIGKDAFHSLVRGFWQDDGNNPNNMPNKGTVFRELYAWGRGKVRRTKPRVAGGRVHEIEGIKLRPEEANDDGSGQGEQAELPF